MEKLSQINVGYEISENEVKAVKSFQIRVTCVFMKSDSYYNGSSGTFLGDLRILRHVLKASDRVTFLCARPSAKPFINIISVLTALL